MKKKNRKKTKQRKFLVIECGDKRFSLDCIPKGQVYGPFPSLSAVEQYLKKDAAGHFDQNEAYEGRNEDWGSTQVICEVLQFRKVVPVVHTSLRFELADVVPEKGEAPNETKVTSATNTPG